MVYAFANKNKYDSLFSISTLTSALAPFFNGFLDARGALTRFFLTNSANSKSEAEFFYVGVFVKELNIPQGPMGPSSISDACYQGRRTCADVDIAALLCP